MRGWHLPLEALHLIRRMALRHPPQLVLGVVGFFAVDGLMARLRGGRWLDSILLSLITTTLLVFAVACLYVLVTHLGYPLFFKV